jgi:hypothetical protein
VYFFFQFISLLCAELWKGEERTTGEWQIKATSGKAQFIKSNFCYVAPLLAA